MTEMTERLEKIRSRLLATFTPIDCQLRDESSLHVGHAGAAAGGGHYRLHLVTDHFEGLDRISRHRLVYDCLHDMIPTDIHALAIIALAPSEVSSEMRVD